MLLFCCFVYSLHSRHCDTICTTLFSFFSICCCCCFYKSTAENDSIWCSSLFDETWSISNFLPSKCFYFLSISFALSLSQQLIQILRAAIKTGPCDTLSHTEKQIRLKVRNAVWFQSSVCANISKNVVKIERRFKVYPKSGSVLSKVFIAFFVAFRWICICIASRWVSKWDLFFSSLDTNIRL